LQVKNVQKTNFAKGEKWDQIKWDETERYCNKLGICGYS